MTSPTETEVPAEGVTDEEVDAWLEACHVELDTESSSSTSSASSPQSSRSGTSSRSLRGLSKTWLVECLPALLVGAGAQIQLYLAQGNVAGERSGKTT